MSKFANLMNVRAQTLQRAQNARYSKTDMVDPNIAIAVTAARFLAQAADGSPDPGVMSQHALNLLKYPGDAPTEGVVDALAAIIDLPNPVRGQLFDWMSQLLSFHASYTHSCPVENTPQEWANQIIDISVNLKLGQDLSQVEVTKLRGEALIEKTLQALAGIFGSLWS